MDTKTEQFKQRAQEANEAKQKNCEELSAETALIHFCQFYQQVERSDEVYILSDLYSTVTQMGPDDEIAGEIQTKPLEEAGKMQHLVQMRFQCFSIKNQTEKEGLNCAPSTKKAFTRTIFLKAAHRFLKPIPKSGKDHHKLNGYCILKKHTAANPSAHQSVVIK